MQNSSFPSFADKRISYDAFGEFLMACLKVGEKRVVEALRKAQIESNTQLIRFIIQLTCDKFDISERFMRNKKITRLTSDQSMSLSIIVFLSKKYLSCSYKDLTKLLGVRGIYSDSMLSKYYFFVTKITGANESERKFIKILKELDSKIEQYIDNNINKLHHEPEETTEQRKAS